MELEGLGRGRRTEVKNLTRSSRTRVSSTRGKQKTRHFNCTTLALPWWRGARIWSSDTVNSLSCRVTDCNSRSEACERSGSLGTRQKGLMGSSPRGLPTWLTHVAYLASLHRRMSALAAHRRRVVRSCRGTVRGRTVGQQMSSAQLQSPAGEPQPRARASPRCTWGPSAGTAGTARTVL